MRVYARARLADGAKKWVVISTAANGDNSDVYLVALCQCLLLNINESPFWAASGIRSQQAVQQQVAPDHDIANVQKQFAQYFANLAISKASGSPPTYNISVVTFQGAVINFALPASASPPNQIPQ